MTIGEELDLFIAGAVLRHYNRTDSPETIATKAVATVKTQWTFIGQIQRDAAHKRAVEYVTKLRKAIAATAPKPEPPPPAPPPAPLPPSGPPGPLPGGPSGGDGGDGGDGGE